MDEPPFTRDQALAAPVGGMLHLYMVATCPCHGQRYRPRDIQGTRGDMSLAELVGRLRCHNPKCRARPNHVSLVAVLRERIVWRLELHP